MNDKELQLKVRYRKQLFNEGIRWSEDPIMNKKELQDKIIGKYNLEQIFDKNNQVPRTTVNATSQDYKRANDSVHAASNRNRHRRRNSSYLINRIAKREGTIAQCRVCHTTQDLTIDHIIPLSAGGSNLMSNKQILCSNHNRCKGSYVPTNGWWPDNLMYVIEAHE
jgi:5-methylcytosine-specific restriction endonuclease McrA